MQLVLEIKSEQDLQMLLLLAQRLKISYSTVGKSEISHTFQSVNVQPETAAPKNYDAEAAKKILAEMARRKMFSDITNPVEWQKQIRNEWD